MKPDKIELTTKRYIQLEKRYNEVLTAIRKSPWRRVPEPYQDGWFIGVEPAENVAQMKGGERIIQAINLCKSNPVVTRDPELVSRIRKKSRFDDVKPLLTYKTWDEKLIYAGPHLRSIREKEWSSIPEDNLVGVTKWFVKEVDTNRKWGVVYNTVSYKCIVPTSYLVIKAKKRIITEEQDINPDLIKERDELRKTLEPYWRKQGGYLNYDKYNESASMRRLTAVAIRRVIKNEITDLDEHRKLSSKYKL